MSELRDARLLEEVRYGTTRFIDFELLEAESYTMVKSMDPNLYKAATKGDIFELCKAMEQEGEQINGLPVPCVQISPQKNTILHIATSFGHHFLVKVIIEDLPSLIVQKNFKGDTALHIAARAGDSSLVSLLINSTNDYSSEAVMGDKNEEGNTALHEALQHCHEKVAWILFDKNRGMSYSANKEGKTPLYLAAEAGYEYLAKQLIENSAVKDNEKEGPNYKSPAEAAILGRMIDVINTMWEKDKSFFYIMCEEGRNPLHCAASIGYLEGIKFLLDKYCIAAYQKDKNGFFPIHTASSKGYINIIQEFLRLCPDSRELLNQEGQNIFHVAVKNGKVDVVNHLLKSDELLKLINEKDDDGNTPLHLATIYQHPKIVSTLTWDKRVNLELVNHKGLTALDIAEGCDECIETVETVASVRKRLTQVALKSAGAPRAQPKVSKSKRQNSVQGEPSKLENYKEKMTIILLVSTFVATVSFQACFTIPGGENNLKPDEGMANLLLSKMFHVFVICNTVAMYSSIVVSVTLVWTQLGDATSVLAALKFALPLLGVALIMMSIAYMASLILVVRKLSWLASVVWFMWLIFLVTLAALFGPLCFLGSSNNQILRYISYYPFCLILLTFGSYDEDDLE